MQISDPHQAIATLQRHILRRRARLLESKGVTVQQFAVLCVLSDTSESDLPTLEIAGRLPEAEPGITRLIDRLERKGMIRRHRGSDRRQMRCSLTQAGVAVVQDLRAEVQSFEAGVFGCLNPNEINVLIHLLRRVLAGFKTPIET